VSIRKPGKPVGGERDTGKPVGGEGDTGKPGMGITQSGGSMGDMVVLPDNGSSLDSLDNGFTSNGNRVRYGIGFGHMVRGWHFDDFLNMFDDIIRNFVWFLNMYGLVDSVNFFLNSDNRCGD
jgi:hypothetical protein